MTLFQIPIEHGIQPVSQLGTVLGLCCSDSSVLTLSSEHLVCFSRIFSADSDSEVKIERKNTIHCGVLLLLCSFICRFSSIGKTEYNHVYVFTNTFYAIVSLLINYI